jgi:site-specific DNA recombinase
MQPRRAVSTQDVPREQWMSIPVPALVEEALFEAVQEQLEENQQRARIGQRGARYRFAGVAGVRWLWVCLLWQSVESKCSQRTPT